MDKTWIIVHYCRDNTNIIYYYKAIKQTDASYNQPGPPQ